MPFCDSSRASAISMPSTDIRSPESPSSVDISIAIVIRTSLALLIKRSLISSSKPSIDERSSTAEDEIDSNELKPLAIKVSARSASTSSLSIRTVEMLSDFSWLCSSAVS